MPARFALTARLAGDLGHRGRHLDGLGQGLAIVALTGLVGGVIEGGRLGFGEARVIAALLVGALAAAGFLITERRTPEPMLPLNLFSRPAFSAAVAFGLMVNTAYYGVIFVLSLYLQRLLGYSALQAGLAFLPLTAGFIASNLISGRAIGAFGSRPPMLVGALVGAVGFGLLLRLDRASDFWTMLPAFLLIPAGMGLAVPAMTTAVLSGAEKARAGIASGALNAARQAGGAAGVAAFGSIASSGGVLVGLHRGAAVSAGLLALAALLSLLVRPDPS